MERYDESYGNINERISKEERIRTVKDDFYKGDDKKYHAIIGRFKNETLVAKAEADSIEAEIFTLKERWEDTEEDSYVIEEDDMAFGI